VEQNAPNLRVVNYGTIFMKTLKIIGKEFPDLL